MSLWRQLRSGFRVLLDRRAADRDVEDEVGHYLEQATKAWVAKGLSPKEAERAARLETGNPTMVRDEVRSYGWENLVGTTLSDLRQAARRLRANPAFTVVSVVTLGLGVGATTAIFSAANPILFEPLPYPEASRLLKISDFAADGSPSDVTFMTFRELAERSQSFSALGTADPWQPSLTGAGEPERLAGQRVTADFFRVFGITPATGRDFDAADDKPGAAKVAIVSHRLVQRRFGGDPAIVGRQITLEGDAYTVVGVMPRGFENLLAPAAEVWTPLRYRPNAPFESGEWGHHLHMVGRLRPGITTSQATHEINQIAHNPAVEFPRPPWADLKEGLIVHPLQDDVTRAIKPALVAILGAVLLVLLIACVNVTNLLLVRAAQRRGEFGLRAALGAGRARLARQLLTESLLLAALGTVVGLVVAEVGIRALLALTPPGLPRVDAIRLDGAVFAFALGVTLVVGLGVGIVPALSVSRTELQATMQQLSPRTVGGHGLTRSALVVAEVALALMLLVSAGLLIRSLDRIFAVDPGFDSSQVLTLQVEAGGHQYDADSARYRFFSQTLEAVHSLPGVIAAGFTSQLPLSGDFDKYGIDFEAAPADSRDDGSAFRYAVTSEYFQAMKIPLRRGRLVDSHDLPGGPQAIVINESFAKRAFPGQDPIGQHLRAGPDVGHPERPGATIVGVVGDVTQASLALGRPDAFYLTTGQWPWVDNVQSLVVRTRGDALALAPSIKRAIWSIDKDQPIVRVATMETLVTASVAERRFALILFEAFALAALVLAAAGIYGVLSGSVTERTREIGVRSALGAPRRAILGLVVRQAMTFTGLGVALGVVGATAATQAIVGMLFGISPLDPTTYFSVIGLLLIVAAISCAIPAWRAARVDPVRTLRTE